MRLIILITAVAILLSACASSTSNSYGPTVQSWKGSSVQSLVNQWGKPDYTVKSPQGDTTLVYKTESYSAYTGTTEPQIGVNVNETGRPVIVVAQNNNQWDRGKMSINCTVIFTASKQGIINSGKTMGPGCYAGNNFAKKYAKQTKVD